MAFHLSHIHDYERFLAVDIGSHRIRTGAFSIESLEPELVGFSSVRQNKKNMHRGIIVDMRGVALSIEKSMIQACQEIDMIPTDILLGFSSSQFLADTLTTQYIRKSNSPISMSEIDTIVKKVEKDSFDRIRTRAKSHYGIVNDDIKLVSSTITRIEIDGKVVTNPIGFGGSRIRFSILNIFSPASEFNVMRSIATHIGKNIISMIPIPLVFPKLLEKYDYVEGSYLIVDVGLIHTTLIFVEDNQILALESFSFGSQMLLDIIAHAHPELTFLQVEHMIKNNEYAQVREDELSSFFQYLSDAIGAFFTQNLEDKSPDGVCIHGGLFENTKIYKSFSEHIRQQYGSSRVERFADILSTDTDRVVTEGLSLIATELLLVKKDPLVRLLRYVLYNYE